MARSPMRTFAPQQKPTQKATSASSARPRRVFSGHSREGSAILNLQRTIGNQAVQRLLRANAGDLERGSTTIPSPRLSHGSCRIPLQTKAHTEIQPQLTISTSGDRYEQEADRVAEQVMRMPEPKIQRLCPECDDELQRSPLEEEVDDTLQTQRRSGQPPATSSSLQNRITALQSGGQPLPASTRAFFEPRFAHDFSGVRVHTDTRAAGAAAAVQARAFTLGQDIVFGSGEYAPETGRGGSLLAHELTHVIQQGGGGAPAGGAAALRINSCNERQIRRSPVYRNWGPFRIEGEQGYVAAVSAQLAQLRGTSIGSALLSEMERYTDASERLIPIRFIRNFWCYFDSSDNYIGYDYVTCDIRDEMCSGSYPPWAAVPNSVYLFHEIAHAYIANVLGNPGSQPLRECMATGLGAYFRAIAYNENRLRCEMGLNPRPCYDGYCEGYVVPECESAAASTPP